MKERLFFDTSAIYAYINLKDPDHKKVKTVIDSFKGSLVITNYVFDEIVTLVTARLGHKIAVHVGNILRNSPQIEQVWISQNDEKDAWRLFTERDDKGYSLTDCTSFVIMRRLKIGKALALDEHFRQEGFGIL